ncbi:hypothetical protein TrST_g5409, partial [Triparma strigata]
QDAVLDVTRKSSSVRNKDGEVDTFTQLARSCGWRMKGGSGACLDREPVDPRHKNKPSVDRVAYKLFPPKNSTILGRRRTDILYEGYKVTEVKGEKEGFPVVQIEYSVEISLGGIFSSANFTRLFYHKQVRRLLEEWKEFAEDPVHWLDTGNAKKDAEEEEILEEALFKVADAGDKKDFGKLWGTNKRVSKGGHVTRLAPKTFGRQNSMFEPKKVAEKVEEKSEFKIILNREQKTTTNALKQPPTYGNPDKGPVSVQTVMFENQKEISKEQKKVFEMRNELKKLKEQLSQQSMNSKGNGPSKAEERRESRRLSQLSMSPSVPTGASPGRGGGGGKIKLTRTSALTGTGGKKKGGKAKEGVTIAMSNLSISGAQPKDEEEGGGTSNPLQARPKARQRASKQTEGEGGSGGGGTSSIEERLDRIKQKRGGPKRGARKGGGTPFDKL